MSPMRARDDLWGLRPHLGVSQAPEFKVTPNSREASRTMGARVCSFKEWGEGAE